MAEEATTVHLLMEGRALCGLGGLPRHWPSGHKWVALNDKGAGVDVNCPGCLAAAIRGEGAQIHKDIFAKATEGKYDAESAAMLALLGAEAVLVIVKHGQLGDGFSIAVDLRRVTAQQILDSVPHVLRDVADKIEEQEREKKTGLQ